MKYFSLFFAAFGVFGCFCYQTRFKRDFMFITDGNMTDAQCFEGCQNNYKSKFEVTLNQSLIDFYDFPFHPVVLDSSSLQLYCKLSDEKTKCFSEKCNDYTAENSFSPSNFVCSFKRALFEKAIKCLAKTEPITFLKCDQECHEEVVRDEKMKAKFLSSYNHNENEDNNNNQVFVSSELANYEVELNKLCRFQSCYMQCMQPIVSEMCPEDEAKSAIEVVELYVQWHADDISDWHAITGNEDTLPKSCQDLVKNHRTTGDPILQLIGDTETS